jgi:ATP diphosphatase
MQKNLSDIQALLEIMADLRDPDKGCPWDQEQTYKSIVPHTLEEAYEVAETIEKEDYDELKGELGDLLFQVVFYSQIAREEGRFDFSDVVHAISEKMLRRHPHVFSDENFSNTDEIKQSWEKIKAEERAEKGIVADVPSALDGVTEALPALTRARKIQSKAKRTGFDWPDITGVFGKLHEELDEVHEALATGTIKEIEHEVGDLLFTVVNLARHMGVDSDASLRGTNRRFEQRFKIMEALALEGGKDFATLDLEQQEALWVKAKNILQD